jgi:hypothetical protein
MENIEDAKDKDEALRNELSEWEIKNWRNYYSSYRNMQEYLYDTYGENANKSLMRNQEAFIPTKAMLAILAHSADDLLAKHGELYRWKMQYERVLSTDKEARYIGSAAPKYDDDMKADGNLAIPEGWRWMLQLRTAAYAWKDWVYIKKSPRGKQNLGVYAARDFCSGTTIGYYSGNVVWRHNVGGTVRPSEEYLKARGVSKGHNSLLMRDKEAKFVVVTAPPLERDNPQSLYMGMHYVNSASDSLSDESEVFTKGYNCILGEDGSLVACRKIAPNTELLYACQINEGNKANDVEDGSDQRWSERKRNAATRKACVKVSLSSKRYRVNKDAI